MNYWLASLGSELLSSIISFLRTFGFFLDSFLSTLGLPLPNFWDFGTDVFEKRGCIPENSSFKFEPNSNFGFRCEFGYSEYHSSVLSLDALLSTFLFDSFTIRIIGAVLSVLKLPVSCLRSKSDLVSVLISKKSSMNLLLFVWSWSLDGMILSFTL